jgi:putative oxidoreductase
LAFVFLSAAIPKLLAPTEFALAVRNYRLLPPRLNEPVARWLPRLELALALTLLAGVGLRAAAALTFAVLLAFAGAIAINLARGRQIDCGCFPAASPRTIGWPLVARDLFLAIGALLILLATPETLAPPNLWSDTAADPGASDGVAIAVVAAIVVLVELLADEALRVKRAARSFALRSGGARS